ncbi:hypothetical protein EOI86_08510 [Hwanghaeella grinnelliae]|uniref:Uncharacterized protein n=1 Tax=Hwanghaeella grinnelliae TaxID=2500179 RepID=A0A437QXS1_9PROT|nr:hypothetical protein [Hwanghaeella grinnelliae]RVU39269.1 hypothetical protein EOI86_08510 [Hwanghaeella grinnelliae]
MTMTSENLFAAFEAQTLDPACFKHRDHIAAAFEMLRRYDFVEAASKYAVSLRAMAEKAGAPEKFNATITLAFLSLIAERMEEGADTDDFAAFEKANSDLESIDVIGRWYSKERMTCDAARKIFLLPDRAA